MNEIEIRNIEDVTIASELVASGGGNYYRNKINFHLSLSKPLSRAESHDFTTELHLVEKEWEVRLVKGPARYSHQSKNDESHQIILEEEVDMSLEDFEHIRYRFPLSQGVANVEFKILDGKVNPVVTHH